jgi:hypothetical protein
VMDLNHRKWPEFAQVERRQTALTPTRRLKTGVLPLELP